MADKKFEISISLRRMYDGENTHNPTETDDLAFQHFLDVWHEILKIIDKTQWYFEDWGWEYGLNPPDVIREMLDRGKKNG